jgi:hypothetical protein
MKLTLFRMGKEREANYKEQAHQLSRIAKMKVEGKDPYDIKKQVTSLALLAFNVYFACLPLSIVESLALTM